MFRLRFKKLNYFCDLLISHVSLSGLGPSILKQVPLKEKNENKRFVGDVIMLHYILCGKIFMDYFFH